MKIKPIFFAANTALGLLLCPSKAVADNLITSFGQPITETQHHVEMNITDEATFLTVERTFENAGTLNEDLTVGLRLPSRAVVTGVRRKADDGWRSATLIDSSAKKYPKSDEPVQISMVDQAELLQIQSVPAGGSVTIEYTLIAPVAYTGGKYQLYYPKEDSGPTWAPITFRFTGESQAYAYDEEAPPFTDLSIEDFGLRVLPSSAPPRPTTTQAQTTTSTIEVPLSGEIKSATLSMKVKNIPLDRLEVSLKTPNGWTLLPFADEPTRLSAKLSNVEGLDPAGAWSLALSDREPHDEGDLLSWSLTFTLTDGQKKTFTQSSPTAILSSKPNLYRRPGFGYFSVSPSFDGLFSARLGAVKLDDNEHVAQAEIDLAPALSVLPRDLSVVFLIDASYSVGEVGLSHQLALLRSFMSHVPDASVELVVYRRHAARVFAHFIEATELDQMLKVAQDVGAFDLDNGSALDEALAIAAESLQGRSGPTMIVGLSDALLRSSLTKEDLTKSASTLSPETTLHFVQLSEREGDNIITPGKKEQQWFGERLNSGLLASVSAAQGGVSLSLRKAYQDGVRLSDISLGLVRPNRVDDLTIEYLGDGPIPTSLGSSSVYEGESLRVTSFTRGAPQKMIIRGKLWQRELREEVAVSPSFSSLMGSFAVSNSTLYAMLSAKQQKALALSSGVVSPWTTLALGGSANRTEEDEEGEGGLGMGLSGAGCGGLGYYGPNYITKSDEKLISKEKQDECFAAYTSSEEWSSTFTVQMSYDEIVDVTSTKSDALATCLTEAFWSTHVTLFTKHSSTKHTIFFSSRWR